MAIVMKYYSGQSLKHYIRSHFTNYKTYPIPYVITFQILIPLFKAISLMHGAGIVHCDVKSGNILLEWVMPQTSASEVDDLRLRSQTASMSDAPEYNTLPVPVPYVTDFGISNVLDQSSSLRVKAFKVANMRGASLPYCAPEVLNHLKQPAMLGPTESLIGLEEEDRLHRAYGRDTYALACVIYEMLIGRSPWSFKVRKY
jgi:serine/threonine protein kinase